MALQKEHLEYVIKHNLKLKEFEIIAYENSDLEQQSIGFLSDQVKKCIKYKTGGKIERLYVFIKQLPESEFHRQNMLEMGSFQRETLVLGEILAGFEDFKIPIPKCYLVTSDSTIILEDLSLRGYKNQKFNETLDMLHCEKVLESLAKFHAASIIIERKKKFKINEKYPIIEREILLNGDSDHQGNKCAMAGIKAMKVVALKYLSEYPKDLTDRAFQFIADTMRQRGTSDVFPNVLTHTDLWVNNIMFKYDDQANLEPPIIIDFQLTTYKPPSFDFQFFLHNCTLKEFRDENSNRLAKYYFDILSKQLELSKIKLNDIMSWSVFEEMQKATLPSVLAKVTIYITFVLMPEHLMNEARKSDEEFNKFFLEDRTDYVLRAMEECHIYNQRTLECLTELFDYIKTK